MSAALLRIDIINIGEDVLVIGVAVLHSHLNDDTALFALQINGLGIDFILILVDKFHKFDNASGKMEGFAASLGPLVSKGNGNALIQKGQLANTQTQGFIAVFRFRKNTGIRFKMHRCAGSIAFALNIQLFRGMSLLKLNAVALAAAAYFYFHMLAQCVNAGNAHAVQAAGNLIAAVAEFAAGVQHRHNDLDGRLLFLFHFIHRNAAAIINDRNAVILMDDDLDIGAVSGQGFVDAVVHNLVHQVVQTAGRRTADIHGRSFTHCFQAF